MATLVLRAIPLPWFDLEWIQEMGIFRGEDFVFCQKARAAGLDIGSVLNDLYAPLSHFRYRMVVQKAIEFCADVKTLGNALLGFLERKDNETLTLLRAAHESKLLRGVRVFEVHA